jgi:hypothetical protein
MLRRVCQYCIYAFKPIGASRAILICVNKEGWEGSLCVVKPEGLCRRFKPKPVSTPQESEIPKINTGKLIPLTQGKFAIVDAEDYDWLMRYKWHVVNDRTTCYAMRSKGYTTVSMHRQIMNAPKGLIVDHIDHNGLNNRKNNLRNCTHSQNLLNRRIRPDCKSKYKGVVWDLYARKWISRICLNQKRINLGCFDNEIDAALAYDRAARKYHGEFACLNFPELATKTRRHELSVAK